MHRAEYLVEKRDGRLEAVCATKLARSILAALGSSAELGDAMELSRRVLGSIGHERVVRAAVLADAVEDALCSAGFTQAAGAFARAGRNRRRRRVLAAEGAFAP